jgi:5-methylcytosine-specific restriction endonuclease McrA
MEQSRTASPLNGSVLVLNRFYMAVHVVSVRRALVLLYRELAEVIHVDGGQFFNYDFESWLELSQFISADEENPANQDGEWIRSVNFSIQVPRVVRLNFYDKVPKLTLRFNRRNLFARDGNRCQYCDRVFPLSQLSFDHVIPRSRGGATTWENVVCCCLKCNTRKGDRTPEQTGMKLIRPPKRPQQNPLLDIKMDNPKYESWKTFLKGSSTSLNLS